MRSGFCCASKPFSPTYSILIRTATSRQTPLRAWPLLMRPQQQLPPLRQPRLPYPSPPWLLPGSSSPPPPWLHLGCHCHYGCHGSARHTLAGTSLVKSSANHSRPRRLRPSCQFLSPLSFYDRLDAVIWALFGSSHFSAGPCVLTNTSRVSSFLC